MQVDLRELAKRGVSSGNYKKIFTLPPSQYPTQIRKLVDLAAARNRDGISLSLKEHRAFAAIDLAYGVPFNQTTPTLVHNILSKNLDAKQTMEALKQWGLSESELFMEIPGAGPNGEKGWTFNAPVFFQTFIPIVKAYVMTVLAQIYNERNTSPLLQYHPLKETTRNRVVCGVLTDIIETVSSNYGYPSVLRQAIHQMLKYGIMLAFPREDWDCQEQIFDDGDGPKRVTIKEGIRYVIPHPTRMFYDLKFPLTSINSDTGCEFIGHWDILSYGQILDDRKYWNRKSIFAGTNWFQAPFAGNYFKEVFPCRMQFPHQDFQPPTRTDKAARYTSANRDQAVFTSNTFMKIIPRQFGLGRYENDKLVDSYDYPVWHRFIMASDDTICWASPCPYTPGWFMGYDYDEQAECNPSLGLELIPWQDQLGNILSQMILTAKQNLANVIFFDTNMVDQGDVDKIVNSGERKYRSWNFIPFDSMMRNRSQLNQANAFLPVQFAKQSIAELLQLVPVVLNIMERVLSIASQEAGAAASHQQSKFEVSQTAGASKNRRALTAASVDEGKDAWKRQLVDAYAAFGDAAIAAQVDAEIPNLEQILTDLGFTIKDRGETRVLVHGNKKALRLEGFARSNEGIEQANEKELASVLFQLCGTISGQPELFKEVGAKVILQLLEEGAKFAGARKDLSLRPQGPNQSGQISPAVMEALQKVQQAIMEQVGEKVSKPAAQGLAQVQGQLSQVEEAIKRMQPIFDLAQKATDTTAIKTKEAEQKMQLREAEFAAEAKRKQEKHALELQQETEKARVDAQIEAQKAASEIHLSEQKTRAAIATKSGEAAAKVHIAKATAKKPKA